MSGAVCGGVGKLLAKHNYLLVGAHQPTYLLLAATETLPLLCAHLILNVILVPGWVLSNMMR